jgi:general secretion pathway protein D
MKLQVVVAVSLLAGLSATVSAADARPAEAGSLSLTELVARIHQKTGRQIIVDANAPMRISLAGLDVERLDYPMFVSILRANGLIAVGDRDAVAILPDAIARQQPMPTLMADDPKIGDDTLVTRLVQLHRVCAAHTVPVLRPLMPQYAHLAAYPPTNTLVITDRADNVRRVAGLAEKLEQAAGKDQPDCAAMAAGS